MVEAPPVRMPHLIWSILYQRGIRTAEEMTAFLSGSLRDLTPPSALHQMDRATERLVRAFRGGEKILLYADFDLDGTPGVALLKKGLERLGFQNLYHYQPRRLRDGYGLHADVLESHAKQGVTVCVTVDVGITDVAAVERANELGMDVIITDHHLPGRTLPPAHAILNPNKEECGSELGHLCGTGVAFYLILGLRAAMRAANLGQTDFDPKRLLDCFAIGTVTDMVPLIRENRILVKHGLKELTQTERPGLRALMEEVGLAGLELTSQDVGFRLAPKLNALSRLDRDVLPLDIFLAEDAAIATQLVGEVMRSHEERVRLQKAAEVLARQQLCVDPATHFIWLWSPEFHQGIVGLLATRLSEELGLPAFIGAGKPDGSIVGSARLPKQGPSGNLQTILQHAAPVLTKFGGHAAAAGFHLPAQNADEFRAALSDYFVQSKASSATVLRPDQDSRVYDLSASLSELTPEFMRWYRHLEPFGLGFPAPVFRAVEVTVAQIRSLRGGHLRLSLRQESTVLGGLWFSPPPGHPVVRHGLHPGDIVDVLFEPTLSSGKYSGGRREVELLIQDLRFH